MNLDSFWSWLAQGFVFLIKAFGSYSSLEQVEKWLDSESEINLFAELNPDRFPSMWQISSHVLSNQEVVLLPGRDIFSANFVENKVPSEDILRIKGTYLLHFILTRICK